MVSFAVIETGGKQYLVRKGDRLKIEKIEKPGRGSIFSFDKVLLLSKEKDVKIGTPYIAGAKVKAQWISEGKAKKVTNIKFKSKTRESTKSGHKQPYTEVLISDF
ncbi:50S ribosomal protein L21 [Patescibacteria group bacterium]